MKKGGQKLALSRFRPPLSPEIIAQALALAL